MEYATIPNCQYKAYIDPRPELNEVKAIILELDGREVYRAAYRSEKTAINAIKRRLKIDADRQNILLFTPKDGHWQIRGWR